MSTTVKRPEAQPVNKVATPVALPASSAGSRINLTSQQLNNMCQLALKLCSPDHHLYGDCEIRPVDTGAHSLSNPPSIPIQTQEVTFNSSPAFDPSKFLPGIELCGQGMTFTLYSCTCLLGDDPDALQACKDQQFIGGSA